MTWLYAAINVLCILWIVFSARQMDLGVSESDNEDEDVAHERRRVSSDDVVDDVLVLQNLSKVRLLPIRPYHHQQQQH